jgi:hypothetical protein
MKRWSTVESRLIQAAFTEGLRRPPLRVQASWTEEAAILYGFAVETVLVSGSSS